MSESKEIIKHKDEMLRNSDLQIKDLLTITEFINETKYNIDSFIIDKFWNNMSNDMDIYIDESIIKWMGYVGEIKKSKYKFIKLLENFIENVDYQILSNKNYENFLGPLKGTRNNIYPKINRGNGKNNTKHILLKPDTFREIMMMLRTKKANDIRKYYLSLEKLIKLYSKYQTEYKEAIVHKQIEEKTQLLIQSREQLEEKENELNNKVEELKIERGRHVALREAVEDVITLEKKQIFYVATSDYYQRRNRYKYGGVESESRLKARLCGYNGDRAEGDRFYYIFTEKCHDYKSIEAYLRGHLPDYCKDSKDRYLKEMVKCPWTIFEQIIQLALHPSGRLTDLINEKRDEIIEGIAIDDMVKKPEIILPEKQVLDRDIKIDAYQLTTDRILEIMTDCINQVAGVLGHQGFDLTKQKNEQLGLELKWGDIVNAIITKTNISRGKLAINKIWKPRMRQLIKTSNCIKKVKGIPT